MLAGTLAQMLAGTLAQMLAGHLLKCLPRHLLKCLPGHFAQKLAGTLAQMLARTLAQMLAGTLAQMLTGTLSDCSMLAGTPTALTDQLCMYLPTLLLLILGCFLTAVDDVQEEVSGVLMLLTFETCGTACRKLVKSFQV